MTPMSFLSINLWFRWHRPDACHNTDFTCVLQGQVLSVNIKCKASLYRRMKKQGVIDWELRFMPNIFSLGHYQWLLGSIAGYTVSSRFLMLLLVFTKCPLRREIQQQVTNLHVVPIYVKHSGNEVLNYVRIYVKTRFKGLESISLL